MNRALEFIGEAYCLLRYSGNNELARQFIRLAVQEVNELLDQIALYESADAEPERRIKTRQTGGVLVEDALTMVPARLVAPQRRCAALPGATAAKRFR